MKIKKKIHRIDPFSCDIYSLGFEQFFLNELCGSDSIFIKKLNDSSFNFYKSFMLKLVIHMRIILKNFKQFF